MDRSILGLAYVVLEVRDPVAWHSFLVSVLGLTEGEGDGRGGRTYRLDDRASRIVVLEGAADDLVALGFEARSRDAMWDVAMRARDEGAFVEEALADEAAARSARDLVRFDEPSGLSIEVGHGFGVSDRPLDRSLCADGFVTGDHGLGHVALGSTDAPASRRFFERVLGMRLSDRIACELRGGFQVDVTFLHVGPRHHTVAISHGRRTGVHHLMLELRSLEDLGRIHDRCADGGAPITKTLGQHPNDRMLSFYARTPSGFEIECGHGGVVVDDAVWEPRVHSRISAWGHRDPRALRDPHLSSNERMQQPTEKTS